MNVSTVDYEYRKNCTVFQALKMKYSIELSYERDALSQRYGLPS